MLEKLEAKISLKVNLSKDLKETEREWAVIIILQTMTKKILQSTVRTTVGPLKDGNSSAKLERNLVVREQNILPNDSSLVPSIGTLSFNSDEEAKFEESGQFHLLQRMISLFETDLLEKKPENIIDFAADHFFTKDNSTQVKGRMNETG